MTQTHECGHEVPRIYTPPRRELTPATTLGYAMIEFAEEVLGITLIPWQRWLLIHAFELQKPIGTQLGEPRLRFLTVQHPRKSLQLQPQPRTGGRGRPNRANQQDMVV